MNEAERIVEEEREGIITEVARRARILKERDIFQNISNDSEVKKVLSDKLELNLSKN